MCEMYLLEFFGTFTSEMKSKMDQYLQKNIGLVSFETLPFRLAVLDSTTWTSQEESLWPARPSTITS